MMQFFTSIRCNFKRNLMAAALIKQNILPASAILRKCRPLEVHKSVLLNTKNLQKGFVVLLTRMHLIKMGLNGGVLLTGY